MINYLDRFHRHLQFNYYFIMILLHAVIYYHCLFLHQILILFIMVIKELLFFSFLFRYE